MTPIWLGFDCRVIVVPDCRDYLIWTSDESSTRRSAVSCWPTLCRYCVYPCNITPVLSSTSKPTSSSPCASRSSNSYNLSSSSKLRLGLLHIAQPQCDCLKSNSSSTDTRWPMIPGTQTGSPSMSSSSAILVWFAQWLETQFFA